MKFLNNINPRQSVAVDFTTATGESRKIYWDEDNRTLSTEMDSDVILQNGQELYQPLVINQTGATIPNGSVVMYDGSVGASGKMKIKLAIGDGTISADRIMGIATQDIINGASGYVTIYGSIRKLNTTGSNVNETWVDGDILYLHPTIPGKLTKVKPSAPNLKVQMARVIIAHDTNGKLDINPPMGSELGGTDSNVQITTLSNRNLLIYDSTSKIWKNGTISASDVQLGNVTNESKTTMFTSPTFTGTPSAPTATVGTNTTQIATTAFVNAEIASDAAPISHVGSTGNAHGVATTEVNGFMSSIDKTKLDGIATNANNYTHPSGFTNEPTAILSGANVISQIQVTSEGHVDAVATRALTPVDISAEPAITTKNTAFNKNYGTTTADVKMNGTQAVGTKDTIARADHVHPTDTSRAAASHTHAESEITNLTTDLAAKQPTLVSGSNIKTINGSSILGSGDLVIQSGGGQTWTGTKAEYDAIVTKDPDILYYITDEVIEAQSVGYTNTTSGLNAATVQQAVDELNTILGTKLTTTGLLNAIKAIDGTGSGIDADLLDGKHSIDFIADKKRNLTAIDLNNANYPEPYICSTSLGLSIGLPYDWWHITYYRHIDNNGFGAQVAVSLANGVKIFTRSSSGTTWSSWTELITSLGGTMTGVLTAQGNTAYTTRQVRNIIIDVNDANLAAMQNGDIWIKV